MQAYGCRSDFRTSAGSRGKGGAIPGSPKPAWSRTCLGRRFRELWSSRHQQHGRHRV